MNQINDSTKYPALDLDFVRGNFPSLKNEFIFMDNAGGSQTLGSVINRIGNYLTNYNVQLGASYKISEDAVTELNKSIQEVSKFINTERIEEVVIGPSTSMLLRILSICLSTQWKPGDEVIVSNSDHEANVTCWTDLNKKGIVIKTWKINPETLEFETDDLKKLLTTRTKLVALVHTSNIIGTINPVRKIADIVHSNGSLFCVDGVAFAPHRLIDVRGCNIDFYAFSFYKVYGAHISMLYGKYNLLKEMDGINHYFIGKDEVPYKFQPGNYNYELTYSLSAVPEYFKLLHDHHFPNENGLNDRNKFRKSFELISVHEQQLSEYLLNFLKTKKKIKIIGHDSGDRKLRVPTISFIHNSYKSSEIVEKVDHYKIGIRFGDFYAKKIIHDLGLVEKDGVVRISLVHYNSLQEVETLIAALENIL